MEQDLKHTTLSGATLPTVPALMVLSVPSLFAHITQFQRGVPRPILDLVRAFHAHDPHASLINNSGAGLYWLSALRYGDLASIELLCRMRQWPELADDPKMKLRDLPSQAAVNERLDVLQWLHGNGSIEPTPWRGDVLVYATSRERDDIAWWLLANRQTDVCAQITSDSLMNAAACGNLTLLQKLIHLQPTALVSGVMDAALRNGHWDVILFLHAHSPAGCSTDGMDCAADEGRLDVVAFLHEHRTEGCTTRAMDSAARNGDQDLLSFLHEYRTEGCTTRAMDDAAYHGELEILEFLYEKRTEGCTENAVIEAADNGHLDVVQYLHETCGVVVHDWRMAERVKTGDLAMIEYVHEVVGVPFDDRALAMATESGNEELIEYVKSHMPTESDSGSEEG